MSNVHQFDVVIIGGGPAGSTAATVLARHGHRVAVLEKDTFPRYHIGESLLPYCYFTLERIGMLPKLRESAFVKKYSVQFASPNGRISQPFYFSRHMDHPAAQTWQVRRDEFDTMLLDNAAQSGATIFMQTMARSLIKHSDQVVGVDAVHTETGEELRFEAPITIDASGRDAFSISRHGWRKRDPLLNKIAIWTYFKGALRDEGEDEGATTVAYLPEKGWFWYIPLHNDTVSVGVVAERDYLYRETRDPGEIFCREIGNNEWIKQHVAPGQCSGEFWVTGDFSYRSQHCAADGLVLTGDAFAFLDPVFSSGVFLALRGGELCGDYVHQALVSGDHTARQFEPYGTELMDGIEAMRKLVYAFYDEKFSWREVFTKYPEIHHDVTDCLIGNLFRDFDAMWSKVGEFADLPQPLNYGKPMVAERAAG